MLRITVEIWPGGDKTRARNRNRRQPQRPRGRERLRDERYRGHNPVIDAPPWSQHGLALMPLPATIGVINVARLE